MKHRGRVPASAGAKPFDARPVIHGPVATKTWINSPCFGAVARACGFADRSSRRLTHVVHLAKKCDE